MSNENVRAVFAAAVAEGKSADETKVEMIKAGCDFKDTVKLYKEWAIETGIMVNTKERAKEVDDILSGLDGLDTEDGFNDAVDTIMDNIDHVDEKKSASLIRAWAKKNEAEVFKRTKGGGKGRNGINTKLFAMLKDNPHTTEAELDAFIDENGSETSKKTWRSHYQNIRGLVNAVAA